RERRELASVEEAQLGAALLRRVAVGAEAVERIEQHGLEPREAPEVRQRPEPAGRDVVEAVVREQRSVVAAQALGTSAVDEETQPRDLVRVERAARCCELAVQQMADVRV